MTGWRVGFAAGPAPLVKAMATVQSQSVTSVCSIAQAATVAALTGPQDDVPRFREAFERRRDLVVEGLRGINGLTLSPPDGAFYGYIGCASLIGRKTPDGTLLGDDTAVAAYLLHGARVASVPGTAFGQSPYIRISTATSDGADRGRGADDRRRGERGVTHAALRTHPDHRRGRPPRHPTAPRPRRPFETLAENEEQAVFDLADMEATIAACEGCDAIVHFGGASREAPWQTILDASIRGSYHIYEGARKYGVKRVVYASSVHAIGYHEVEAHIGVDAPVRPDSLYGVSKNFVESLSRLYWDKFGIETVCLRIFSSFPEPTERRMLWSYLSFADCVRLTEASLTAPRVGHTISFGMSDNKVKTVDNSGAEHLGYVPRDSSEPFRVKVEAARPPVEPKAPSTRYLGGWFCELGHPDDEGT